MAQAQLNNGAFNLSELRATPNIVQDETMYKLWGDSERTNQFLGVLNTLSKEGFQDSIKAKRIRWAIGDHPSETATLGATFTIAGTTPSWTGSDSTITLTESKFVKNSLLHLYDTVTTNLQATVRLLETSTGSGSSTLDVEVISGDTGTYATATTLIYVGTSAHEYERDEALDYINFKGTLVGNSMTATRSEVGSGKYERSANFLVDNTLEHKMNLHWKDFQKKTCTTLLANRGEVNAETNTSDFGLSAGIPGILIDGVTDGTDTFKGTNAVTNASAISEQEIRWYLAGDLTAKGSDTRLVIGSPAMINQFFDAFNTSIDICTKEPVFNLMPEYDDVWMLPTFNVGFCKLQFITDRQIGKIRQKLTAVDVDPSVATTLTAQGASYLIFLDPTQIGITYMEVEGEGIKTPQVREVSGTEKDNKTIDKKEIEAVWSFWIKEPSTCGYFMLGGS